MGKPNLVLFSSLLLPPSQTFIRATGEQLQQFTPYYVGSRLVKGLELPPERTIVVNQGSTLGKVSETAFKLFGFAPQLYQQVRSLQPVLIHAQFGLSGVLALPLARSFGLPLIVHFRGADATLKDEYVRFASLNHWLYLQRRETLKREASLFITVSKFIKNKLLEQGFPSDKVIALYSGINVNDFSPDSGCPREPIVLFVGRLTEKKGCEYLIKAMEQVQAIHPEVELVIIGDGPLRENLEAQAAQLPGGYHFLGTQQFTVVRQWMNRARLLVAPSVTAVEGDSEGLPNVVLEAQAMGLPVVSTFHAGIPEGVLQGETGFLVPERDVDQLANYTLKLLLNPDLWHQFSQRGQTHVRSHFDRATQVQILEDIYRRVVRQELGGETRC